MALQEDRNKSGIAVVGAGTTGYLTTIFLCQNYPGVPIRWIYPEDNKPIGVGEATVPEVTKFLRELGITPEEMIKNVNGTVKLGIEAQGFFNKNESFYHPFGDTESDSVFLRECMSASIVPNDILDYDIGMHFDVRELMDYLDNTLCQYENLTIGRHEVGSIDEIQEDIIIDCTGFKRHIINQVKQDNFISITDKIPNDTALVYRGPYKNEKQRIPYTKTIAKDHGWIWNIPLGDTLTAGYVHSSKCKSLDVLDEFIEHLHELYDDVDTARIHMVPMITGRLKEHIIQHKNKTVIALGLSSFFIEPLESTGLYLVVYGIRLLDKMLSGELSHDMYNRTYNHEFDVILDFIIAHYKYTQNDNEYWNQYKQLAIKPYVENHIFPERSWDYILNGMHQTYFEPDMTIHDKIKLTRCASYDDWYTKQK